MKKKKYVILYRGVGGKTCLTNIIKRRKTGLNGFTKDLEIAKEYAIAYASDLDTVGFVYKVKIPISEVEHTKGPDEWIFIGDYKKMKILKKIRVW